MWFLTDARIQVALRGGIQEGGGARFGAVAIPYILPNAADQSKYMAGRSTNRPALILTDWGGLNVRSSLL